MSNTTPTKTRIARKTRLLGLLAVAVSAIALVPAAASAKTIKVETSPIDFNTSKSGDSVDVFGHVDTTRAKDTCMNDRDVTIEQGTGGGFAEVGSTHLDNGYFNMLLLIKPEYRFTVDRKIVIKGKNKKIVCLPVSSVLEF